LTADTLSITADELINKMFCRCVIAVFVLLSSICPVRNARPITFQHVGLCTAVHWRNIEPTLRKFHDYRAIPGRPESTTRRISWHG